MSSYHASKGKKDSLNISLVAYEMSCNTIHYIPVWRGPQIIANVNLRQRSSNYLIPNKPLCLNKIVLYLAANSVPRANKVIVDWTINRLQHILKVRVLNFDKRNMTINHSTSKAIAKLVDINDCCQPPYLRTSHDRLILLLLLVLLLPFSLSRSSVLKTHRMSITKMSVCIRCDLLIFPYYYKVVLEAIVATPGMKIWIWYTLIIRPIVPDWRLFKPSPFTRSVFDKAKELMPSHKLLRYNACWRWLR